MTNDNWKPKHSKSIKFRKTKMGNVLIFPRYAEKEIKYHSFFKLGVFESKIFFLCNGKNTLKEIMAEIYNNVKKKGALKKKVYSETKKFVTEMKQHDLIE